MAPPGPILGRIMIDWMDLIIRIGTSVGLGTLTEIGGDGFGATDPHVR